MTEERWMRCTDRLMLANEPKSTRSAGKLFQRFITRSAKKLYRMELLQKCLKILYGWPLVELCHKCAVVTARVRFSLS